MKNFVFFLGVGLLFTHELDAMLNQEWRVLPLTSWLSDENGQLVFLVAHVPLFAVLVALISSSSAIVRTRTRLCISAFLALHGALHAAFMMSENYRFESVLSNTLIFGGAICGIAYLVLNYKSVAKRT